MAIGIVGDAGVRCAALTYLIFYALLRRLFSTLTFFHFRANAQQPKLFVGMLLILIFAEVLALYGLVGTSLLFRSCQACITLSPTW